MADQFLNKTGLLRLWTKIKAYHEADFEPLMTAKAYGPSNVAAFNGETGGLPLKTCTISITPIQTGSGDPSPSNVRSISGWTGARVTNAGKNILPLTLDGIKAAATAGTWSGNVYTAGGLTFSIHTNEEGYVTSIEVNGKSTESTGMTLIGSTDRLNLRPGNYTLNGCTGGQGGANYTYYLWATGYGSTVAQAVSSATVTITKPKQNLQIGISVNTEITMDHVMIYPMLRPEADTVATFEPYRGTIHDFAWESEAGTVYGGTLDVLTGTLTADRVCKTLAGTDIQARGGSTTAAGDYRFYCTAATSEGILLPPNAQTAADVLCSVASAIPHGDSSLHGVSINRADSRIYLHIQDCGQMTIAQFRAWVDANSVQVSYRLAAPITYQIAPQIVTVLEGQNNIWADCGDTTVEYGAFLQALHQEIETIKNTMSL